MSGTDIAAFRLDYHAEEQLMRKLGKDLKRILSGLAQQDAGEYLSMRDKMQALGYGTQTGEGASAPTREAINRSVQRRVGLIIDARVTDAPVEYAIDACLRQDARLDLLIHGISHAESVTSMEMRAYRAGVDCTRIQLGTKPVDAVVDHLSAHALMIFLVASADDTVARVLVEERIPTRGYRMPVPLVLIDDRTVTGTLKRSAA